jgi:hypothetical protein
MESMLDRLTDCYRADQSWTLNAVNLMIDRLPEVKGLTRDQRGMLVEKLAHMAWMRWQSPNFQIKVKTVRELRNQIWDKEMNNGNSSSVPEVRS